MVLRRAVNLTLVLVSLCFGSSTMGYKILIVQPFPSYSHQQPILALTDALIKKGHEVFLVGPNTVEGLEAEANYTYVDVSSTYAEFSPKNAASDSEGAINLQKETSHWELFSTVLPTVARIPAYQFRSEAFQKFQRNVKAKSILFDVVLSEAAFVPHVCAMARHLTGNKPIIAFSTLNAYPPIEEALGSRVHLSYVPIIKSFTDRMSLWEKMENWIFRTTFNSFMKRTMEAEARAFFRTEYGPEYESLVDGCWSNVSLALMSSNFLYHYPRALAPNVVGLGPMHIRPPQKLPQVLQDWMDGAEKGVIYFSLGGNMKSTSLPLDVRSNLLRVFKELPPGYRVLWKWEKGGDIPHQPANILAHKWLPQQSIFAHPKIKAFITHGGLQGFQEAVHYGVPTIGIPWFTDQGVNVEKMVTAGIGIRLLPKELQSYEKIKAALDAVLFNESFSMNMKKLSAISRDFTPHAVDNAIFWIEHVAKHGGAHLRPSTADSTLFEFLCLDIISVVLITIFIIIYIIVYTFKRIFLVLSPSSNLKIKKS